MYTSIHIYTLLHLNCNWISFSNLNLIDWFFLRGWLNNKWAICIGTAPSCWDFISLFERPRTRLVGKIGSQNQSIDFFAMKRGKRDVENKIIDWVWDWRNDTPNAMRCTFTYVLSYTHYICKIQHKRGDRRFVVKACDIESLFDTTALGGLRKARVVSPIVEVSQLSGPALEDEGAQLECAVLRCAAWLHKPHTHIYTLSHTHARSLSYAYSPRVWCALIHCVAAHAHTNTHTHYIQRTHTRSIIFSQKSALARILS